MSFKAFLHRLNRRDLVYIPFKNLYFQKTLLFLVFIFGFIILRQVYAQVNLLQNTQEAFKKGNNQESWLNNAVSTNIVTGINMLAGEIPDETINTQYNFNDESTGETSYQWQPGGAIGIANNMINSIYASPPASGVQYLAQIKNNFLGKPAYAEENDQNGIGYRGLQPILPLWKFFRNFVYSIMSIYLIILGIMIMLRVKISPQAVINIQNSIPRVITTLVLVTFSYAIAGLLIDFMYVIQSIALYMMFQIRGISLVENLLPVGNNTFKALNQSNFSRHFNLLTRFIFRSDMSLPIVFSAVAGGLWSGFSAGMAGTAMIAGSVSGITLASSFIIGAIGALFILLLLFLFIFYQIGMLLFGLFKCYTVLILQIIFAPVIIAMGIFPGSKTDFSSWLKQVLANLTVFPAVYLFLVFMNLLIFIVTKGYGATLDSQLVGSAPTTNILGELWAPGVLSWGARGFAIQIALSLTSFLIAAKIPALLPQTLFNIKPSPWGQAGEQSFSGMLKSPMISTPQKFVQQRFAQGKEAAYQEKIRETARKIAARDDISYLEALEKAKEAHTRPGFWSAAANLQRSSQAEEQIKGSNNNNNKNRGQRTQIGK